MIQPRKRFGQHFLHDPGVIRRIVEAINPQADERLVEIGPGLGALTVPLLQRLPRLEVIEIDRDVIPKLQQRCLGMGELVVHSQDVLTVDFAALKGDGPPLRVCGNLPYNISTPLLFHLLQFKGAISDMHFMLQKEVVDRMAAKPGNKIYGRLTVMLAAACEVESMFHVGRGAFNPPPAVDSAVVRLRPHTSAGLALTDTARFSQVVAAAFSQRRKTLRNSLAALADADTFKVAGIDPTRRPETLSPAEFAALANAPAPAAATIMTPSES